MAKNPIKKATNGTYYFRANLGYNPVTGKQIQKYRSGFKTKKEAKEEYSKLFLASAEELEDKKNTVTFEQFIEEVYLPWYKTQVKESTYINRRVTIQKHFKYFYKMSTDEIEPINVQNWQLKMAKEFSPNYILMIITSFLYIAILYRYGIGSTWTENLDLIKYLILTPMLLSVVVIDYKLQIIPNRLNLTMFEIGLIFTFLYGMSNVAISINMLLGMLAGRRNILSNNSSWTDWYMEKKLWDLEMLN